MRMQRISQVIRGLPDVVQCGRSILRKPTVALTREDLRMPWFKSAVNIMIRTLRHEQGYGLAAPQVDMNHAIFIAEVTNEHVNDLPALQRKEIGIEVFPLTVFVNPKITVAKGSPSVTLPEGCLSVKGFSANVSRPRDVTITYLDRNGDPKQLKASNYLARILQHEMDHLGGTLYIDRMDTRSFGGNQQLREEGLL
eukprot:CFRG4756T1